MDMEKLKRSNQELKEIIDNSWDGIGIIDKSSKFIYVNNAFMPILGFDKNELINQEFTSFMQKAYISNFKKLLSVKVEDKKYRAEADIVCIRKDKKRVYLKITISSTLNKNLFVINTKDITEQISDNEILDDYVVSMQTDLHGHITKVSTAFLKLAGYKKEQLIGKAFSSLAHKDADLIVYKNIQKSLENLQEWSGKLKKVKLNGTAFWIDMKIKPMFNKYGDVIGYTAFMFDITKEINLDDETSVLQEQVNIAKDEIIQKNKLLTQQSKVAIISETIQRLSHEWRQPLNHISLKAQKLALEYEMEGTSELEKTIQVLEDIKNEADLLSSTIENLQKYLEPKTNKEKMKVSKLLAKIMAELKNSLKNIEINIEIKDDIEYETYFNETKNLFFNILNNSKEAIEKNNIKNSRIEIKEYFLNDSIYFEISDNGGGIDEDTIHKIFEPYFSTKEKKHGVGLGLYTSKLIVNTLLNGIITVHNNNFGVTFKISIPLK